MLEPRVVWSPRHEVDIGPHVFPTLKYRLVRERLLERGTVSPEAFLTPEAADDASLLLVHAPDYLRKIAEGALTSLERARLEVPFSRDLADAMRLCCGGTLLTSRRALKDGVAVHPAGASTTRSRTMERGSASSTISRSARPPCWPRDRRGG